MEENGKKSKTGVARLIMNQDLTCGKAAVLVHDRFQGKRKITLRWISNRLQQHGVKVQMSKDPGPIGLKFAALFM
jgi:hypothetical protein